MPRTLLFGDLHVHSSWSFDAYGAGVTARPRDAYRYARGESIAHAGGVPIRLAGPPLDFMALTDHAEYLGVMQAAFDPQHVLRKQPLIRSLTGDDPRARRLAFRRIRETFGRREGLPALTQPSVVEPAWRALVRLAQEQNRPGEFTTFAAFEYTSDVEGRNLHRNVLFRGSAPARPYSSMDSRNPEDLWRWMETSRAAGHDALAIPHNPNGSDGRMFAATRFDGGPIDADWVALRARNEPAMEVFQIKGASETHPALSPDDPFAGFEIVDVRTTAPALASRPEGSYLRDALRRGLAIAGATGANPYRLGVIASTDGHNAASPFEEDNYTGKIGNNDSTPEARLAVPAMPPGAEPVVSIVTRWGAAGLTGVWAKANTREGVFDAIRRRESYGTSGPRIRVRVAAGWTLPDGSDPGALLDREDAVAMGGVLPARPEAAARPTFVIAAQRDPRSAPLDRVQVVRGWMDGSGRTHERVFDVVCADGHAPGEHGDVCPASDAEPDPKTCAGSAEAGQAELRVRWQDPLPPSAGGTFYYVRVLEVPTCRWSTWDALRTKRPPPSGVPTTIQERAVTSPIWTH
ncbi:MAG: DUF3604 domain-containing protein [Myxococcota bacterium]